MERTAQPKHLYNCNYKYIHYGSKKQPKELIKVAVELFPC